MYKTMFKPRSKLIFLLMGLLCFWGAQVMAQVPEKPDPPSFITELVNITELTQEQMEQMRSDGLGWGNIMIATRLTERIAADSDGVLTFEEALAVVLNARAEGKGFGQIAHENDLKAGRVLGDEDTPNADNPPPFIDQLIDITDLTPEQVEQMRSEGAGWGNIMIATRLAERIAADSGDTMTFEEALTSVLEARAQDKGFGQIAHENDLKLGRVVGNGNKVSAAFSYGNGDADDTPNLNRNLNQERERERERDRERERERIRNQERKQNIFGRFMNMLGFGRRERPEKPPKPEKLERLQRQEKPEKPEKPAKPEKLERPERPAKPEKPERGLGR